MAGECAVRRGIRRMRAGILSCVKVAGIGPSTFWRRCKHVRSSQLRNLLYMRSVNLGCDVLFSAFSRCCARLTRGPWLVLRACFLQWLFADTPCLTLLFHLLHFQIMGESVPGAQVPEQVPNTYLFAPARLVGRARVDISRLED